jgi:hypothetical protein
VWADATKAMASATVPALTGLPEAESWPSCTRCANICSQDIVLDP